MIRTLCAIAAAAVIAAAPLSAVHAEPAVVDLDTAVNCAVVFGIIASEQQRGAPGADAYPPLAERGKEFFVQVGARLIDEQHLNQDQAREYFQSRAKSLQNELASASDPKQRLDALAGPCINLLDAAIPAR
ncbi:hypothetical protein [Novosphingobium sp.]|uniref:hypothetical protein n=1 Tax=Novosphingobium sp. TaxID=1874826 RepID=UPI0035AE2220